MIKKEVEELLAKQTVSNYKKAAKIILTNDLTEYCHPLVTYVEKLLITRKSYDTICKLIEVIGQLNCQSAVSILEKICNEDSEHDLITIYASKAYIRLVRKNLSDVTKIIEFLKSKKWSVKQGALYALGYDKMVPLTVEQEEIIKLSWNFGDNKVQGLLDPRYGIVAACAGWNADNVDDFLEFCMESYDKSVRDVASSSLKRKYVKLR